MNYEQAMRYIKNTAKFGSNLGLSRTEKILEKLGNPHKKLKCIHIAGTNGKGSTTSMISNILIKAGYKTGIYISPYLEEFEERIQINNNNISHESLSKAVSKVAEAVQEVIAEGYDHPTEFEIITCAMFSHFYEENVDYAVIEVGLGGRLDSTNVISPILSIITSISYDHVNILGDTLGEIAYEKAGIVKPGIPVVTYPQEKESLLVIERVCNEKDSKLVRVSKDSASFIRCDNHKQIIEIKTEQKNYEIELGLLGFHQILNCSLVIHAVEALIANGLEIGDKHIRDGLSTVIWPGRMEILREKPLVVIDGAHNIDGIRNLSNSISAYFEYRKLYLILGILADKQVHEMVSLIVPNAEKVFTVTPNNERAETANELKNIVLQYNSNCESVENYKVAFNKALEECHENDLLLVCGSLYMIGDMRKIIRISK